MRLSHIKCLLERAYEKILKKSGQIPLQIKKGAYHFNKNPTETFQSLKNIELFYISVWKLSRKEVTGKPF